MISDLSGQPHSHKWQSRVVSQSHGFLPLQEATWGSSPGCGGTWRLAILQDDDVCG